MCVLFYVYMYRERAYMHTCIYIACIPRHEEVTELQGSSSAVLYLILSLNLEFAFQLAVQAGFACPQPSAGVIVHIYTQLYIGAQKPSLGPYASRVSTLATKLSL